MDRNFSERSRMTQCNGRKNHTSQPLHLRKILSLSVIALLILLLSACGSGDSESVPGSEPGSSMSEHGRILLKLERFDPKNYSEEAAADFEEMSVNISCPGLSECTRKVYDGDESLLPFVSFLSDKFGVSIDSKWTCSVHFLDFEGTVGFVQFIYWISDEIETNRAVTFVIQDGLSETMTYSYLDKAADEAALIKKYEDFISTHEQERTNILGEGFSISNETTNIVYNYKTEALTYSYNIFFIEEDSGIIINDYGTEVTIK